MLAEFHARQALWLRLGFAQERAPPTLVMRAVDLFRGRNPFWTEACWLEVRMTTWR